jgi:hypothetical protein
VPSSTALSAIAETMFHTMTFDGTPTHPHTDPLTRPNPSPVQERHLQGLYPNRGPPFTVVKRAFLVGYNSKSAILGSRLGASSRTLGKSFSGCESSDEEDTGPATSSEHVQVPPTPPPCAKSTRLKGYGTVGPSCPQPHMSRCRTSRCSNPVLTPLPLHFCLSHAHPNHP